MRIHTRQDDRFHALIPQPDPEIGSYDEQSRTHILPHPEEREEKTATLKPICFVGSAPLRRPFPFQ